jgi:hypothetical protein
MVCEDENWTELARTCPTAGFCGDGDGLSGSVTTDDILITYVNNNFRLVMEYQEVRYLDVSICF